MIINQREFLRELIEQLLSGNINADQARATLWQLDQQTMAAKNEQSLWWWVVCKDHSSKYRTEARAQEVRQSIEQLTRTRPNLGCPNEHLIIQSAVDPRGEQGKLFDTVANTVAPEDIPPDQPGDPWYGHPLDEDADIVDVLEDAAETRRDAWYAADYPPDESDEQENCWWCHEPLGATATPISVQIHGSWQAVYVHGRMSAQRCYRQWLTQHDDTVGHCRECGLPLWPETQPDGSRKWFSLVQGRKRYTCHPLAYLDENADAHSEHKVEMNHEQG